MFHQFLFSLAAGLLICAIIFPSLPPGTLTGLWKYITWSCAVSGGKCCGLSYCFPIAQQNMLPFPAKKPGVASLFSFFSRCSSFKDRSFSCSSLPQQFGNWRNQAHSCGLMPPFFSGIHRFLQVMHLPGSITIILPWKPAVLIPKISLSSEQRSPCTSSGLQNP